jgi:hypothetical protein
MENLQRKLQKMYGEAPTTNGRRSKLEQQMQAGIDQEWGSYTFDEEAAFKLIADDTGLSLDVVVAIFNLLPNRSLDLLYNAMDKVADDLRDFNDASLITPYHLFVYQDVEGQAIGIQYTKPERKRHRTRHGRLGPRFSSR